MDGLKRRGNAFDVDQRSRGNTVNAVNKTINYDADIRLELTKIQVQIENMSQRISEVIIVPFEGMGRRIGKLENRISDLELARAGIRGMFYGACAVSSFIGGAASVLVGKLF